MEWKIDGKVKLYIKRVCVVISETISKTTENLDWWLNLKNHLLQYYLF